MFSGYYPCSCPPLLSPCLECVIRRWLMAFQCRHLPTAAATVTAAEEMAAAAHMPESMQCSARVNSFNMLYDVIRSHSVCLPLRALTSPTTKLPPLPSLVSMPSVLCDNCVFSSWVAVLGPLHFFFNILLLFTLSFIVVRALVIWNADSLGLVAPASRTQLLCRVYPWAAYAQHSSLWAWSKR